MGDIRKGVVNLMFNGTWVELGDVEFTATEDNRIEKVISFTPREFPVPEGEVLKVPSERVDPPRVDKLL